MAYVRHTDGTFCGGVLVAPTRVLTAGHCVTEDDGNVSSPRSMQVVIGRRTLTETGSGETFAVVAIARNPRFAERADHSLDFDTAMLTLSRATPVVPASLGSQADWANDVTVMGWGHINHEANEYSNVLLAADLPTWTDSQCEASWGADYDPLTNFCAGYYYGEKAVCHGDSGGPVMTTPDRGATWKLIGVVSVVKSPCDAVGYPGIFAWVAGPTLREWVASALTAAPPVAPAPATAPVAAAPAPPGPVNAPARALTMSRGDAVYALRRLIKSRTHHAPRRLSVRCRRTSAVSFACTAIFRVAGRRYAGRFNVREYTNAGVVYWSGVFRGHFSGRSVTWR